VIQGPDLTSDPRSDRIGSRWEGGVIRAVTRKTLGEVSRARQAMTENGSKVSKETK